MPAEGMATNYDKWDAIYDSDDDNYDRTDDAGLGEHVEQHHSMLLLSSYMSEAAPKLDEVEQAKLVRFIAVQDLSWAAKRPAAAPPRAKAITEFLEKEGEPSFAALVSLCHVAKRYSEEDAERPATKAAGARALIMAMGCLNTLEACRQEGGARKLFDQLRDKPRGDLRRRLDAYEFAKAAIQRQPALAAVRPGDAKADEVEATEEDEADSVAAALAARPSVPPKLPVDSALGQTKQGGRWNRILHKVARAVLMQMAFVSLGLVCREAYQALRAVPAETEL